MPSFSVKHLYTVEETKAIEQAYCLDVRQPLFSLMRKAAQAVLDVIVSQYSQKKSFLVLCGGGKNGGDAFLIAHLLRELGKQVTLIHTQPLSSLTGDERKAADVAKKVEQSMWVSGGVLPEADVIIDGLMGTGFSGVLRRDMADLIYLVNQHSAPIVSIDIPSGVCADTGGVEEVAIKATHTVTFITLKLGLLTGQGPNYVGKLHLDELGVNSEKWHEKKEERFCIHLHSHLPFPPRPLSAHKGLFGHVLCLGGDEGMPGAVSLTAEAALKTGAGRVTVATHPAHAHLLPMRCAEVMSTACASRENWEGLTPCNVIAIGPGMKQSPWSEMMFEFAMEDKRPKVLDAGALSFLTEGTHLKNVVMTPHAGEAAQLLNVSIEAVEMNRLEAAKALQEKYAEVVVLKGAGSIIQTGSATYLCPYGSPSMATAGMGDVLTGIIVSLIAQGHDLVSATCLGVGVHALAGEVCEKTIGQHGVLASELIHAVRKLINCGEVDVESRFRVFQAD